MNPKPSAFVAYVDGELIEDNDVWCPGVVCANGASGGNKNEGSNRGGVSLSLVVDILGPSQAEFAVGTNSSNLTVFPGCGEHLETLRYSVAVGLVGRVFESEGGSYTWQATGALRTTSNFADKFQNLFPAAGWTPLFLAGANAVGREKVVCDCSAALILQPSCWAHMLLPSYCQSLSHNNPLPPSPAIVL